MKLCLLARSTHPDGYGSCRGDHPVGRSGFGPAHGYIVIAVICDNDEVDQVIERSRRGIQWDNRTDNWYAALPGSLDFLFAQTISGDTQANTWDQLILQSRLHPMSDKRGWFSIGDNRAFAVLTMEEFKEATK